MPLYPVVGCVQVGNDDADVGFVFRSHEQIRKGGSYDVGDGTVPEGLRIVVVEIGRKLVKQYEDGGINGAEELKPCGSVRRLHAGEPVVLADGRKADRWRAIWTANAMSDRDTSASGGGTQSCRSCAKHIKTAKMQAMRGACRLAMPWAASGRKRRRKGVGTCGWHSVKGKNDSTSR